MPNVFGDVTKEIRENITTKSDKKIQFRDSGIYLQSSSDGTLDIVSDTTVALSGAVTMDSTLEVTGALTQTGASSFTGAVNVAGSATVANVIACDGIKFRTRAIANTLSATLNSDESFVTISPGGTGSVVVCYAGAPAAGKILAVSHIAANTGTAQVVLSPGCTFDGTNGTATLNAANECLVVLGISATRYVILENIGTVAFPD